MPELGLFLLAYQLLATIGLTRIPPVTLAAIALQILIYLGVVGVPRTCLAGAAVTEDGEWVRLVVPALRHTQVNTDKKVCTITVCGVLGPAPVLQHGEPGLEGPGAGAAAGQRPLPAHHRLPHPHLQRPLCRAGSLGRGASRLAGAGSPVRNWLQRGKLQLLLFVLVL